MHRVQRVPATESQGRIHTSTTGVLVFPEVDEPEEVEINPNDLKIDVFRSSRPRRPVGQHDRLRGAHHPPADGHRRVDAEREVAAAEPRGRHARAARAHPRASSRRSWMPRHPTPASRQIRAHGPLRAHPHLQLPREPHRRPPHRLQGVQPRPGDERRARARSSSRPSRPTKRRGSPPSATTELRSPDSRRAAPSERGSIVSSIGTTW